MLKHAAITLVVLIVTMSACQQSGVRSHEAAFLADVPRIDLLIENADILDGLGNPPVRADVVVVGDTIVFVGDNKFTQQDLQTRVIRRIDAAGRTLAPGFIDLHAHGDPLKTPEFENFLAMGVTTITLGQDGSSPEVPRLDAWLERVAARGIGVNLAMFVGHGTLRTQAGIDRKPEPSAAQLQRMLDQLTETLTYTFGLSTGLEYNPGLNAQTGELHALAKVVGRADRVIMSHMRNEDDDKIEASIRELLDQGKFARVHIAHLKSVYGKGAARGDEILGLLAAARAAGVAITVDVYPYIASYTGISILFPVWAKTQVQFEDAKQNRREELELYLRNRVNKRNGPAATLLGTEPYTGKTLADLASEFNLPFEQVLIDKIGPLGAHGAYFVMNDEVLARFLVSADTSISSDGSPTGFHPRGHGTYAKVIEEYVVKRRLLSLQGAVRKMTSQPAKVLGLQDRGVIAVGKKADLVIFDATKVQAKATYSNPLQLAEGFTSVIVNGRLARHNGVLVKDKSGLVLSPN